MFFFLRDIDGYKINNNKNYQGLHTKCPKYIRQKVSNNPSSTPSNIYLFFCILTFSINTQFQLDIYNNRWIQCALYKANMYCYFYLIHATEWDYNIFLRVGNVKNTQYIYFFFHIYSLAAVGFFFFFRFNQSITTSEMSSNRNT